jgi:ATP-dependent DNA helicase RecQ
MDILERASEVLRDRFNLAEFRPKQKEVIERILNGHSTLALLPTGYGKSICYQVPSQILPAVTIVVSPLIALMQDQLAGLRRRGIHNATVLNSSVSGEVLRDRVEGIREGQYRLIYVAPERFESSLFRELLMDIDVSLLVIDEAHCISQWGHDFRPHYRNLHEHTRDMRVKTVLALTATATPAVRADIQNCLKLAPEAVIETSFDRPNLHFQVNKAASIEEKDTLLADILRDTRNGTSIVYTSTRKDAERVADVLQAGGFSAACYHAGMSPDARSNTQRRFESEELRIIVSTVAFGMGVDKANIRRVVHYNLPGSLENYYQESGRAGRDGEPATCTLLYQSKDIRTQKFFIIKNYPTDAQVQDIYEYVRKNSGCSAREVISMTGIDESAFNSAVDFLKQTHRITTGNGGTLRDANPSILVPGKIDTSLLTRRKQAEDERLSWMLSYAQEKQCRRKAILNYFGQKLEASCSGCDHCDEHIFSTDAPSLASVSA